MTRQPLTRRAALVMSWHRRSRQGFCSECGQQHPCRTYRALRAAEKEVKP